MACNRSESLCHPTNFNQFIPATPLKDFAFTTSLRLAHSECKDFALPFRPS